MSDDRPNQKDASIVASKRNDNGNNGNNKETVADVAGVVAKQKRVLVAANFFVETNRLEPFSAVYLIQMMGWNEALFGIVSLVMNAAILVFQRPAGAFFNTSKNTSKNKNLTVVAILLVAITTTMVVWTSNFWILLFGKAVEGVCAAVFLPGLMALLVSVCVGGTDYSGFEVPNLITLTGASNRIGSFLMLCACAAISYYNSGAEAIFYLLGAGGLAAAILTLCIPGHSETTDGGRDDDDNDDDNDDANDYSKETANGNGSGEDKKDDDSESGNDLEARNKNAEQQEEQHTANQDQEGESNNINKYLELLKDRGTVLFAILTFLYHLSHAGVVTLLAQYVATITPDETQLTWASVILIVCFIAQAITSHVVSGVVVDGKFNCNTIILVSFVVLPIRCALIATMVSTNSNNNNNNNNNSPWALVVAAQILDGIGNGVYDSVLPIVAKKITAAANRGGGNNSSSNSYNYAFALGFVMVCWRTGYSLSLLLGEVIVFLFGYTASFGTLGVLGLLNLLIFVVCFDLKPSSSSSSSEALPNANSNSNNIDIHNGIDNGIKKDKEEAVATTTATATTRKKEVRIVSGGQPYGNTLDKTAPLDDEEEGRDTVAIDLHEFNPRRSSSSRRKSKMLSAQQPPPPSRSRSSMSIAEIRRSLSLRQLSRDFRPSQLFNKSFRMMDVDFCIDEDQEWKGNGHNGGDDSDDDDESREAIVIGKRQFDQSLLLANSISGMGSGWGWKSFRGIVMSMEDDDDDDDN